MVDYQIIPAMPTHVGEIADNIRPADRREICLVTMARPYPAIMRGYQDSHRCYTVLYDDEPVAMFGVAFQNMLGMTGLVWMLSTHKFAEIPMGRRELILMKDYVRRLIDGYDTIENYVSADNTVSIKWLKFLGFKLDPAEPYGPFGYPFHHFYMRA